MDSAYRNVFLSTPGLACLVAPDFTIVDTNSEFSETQAENNATQVKFDKLLPSHFDKVYFAHIMGNSELTKMSFDPMEFQTISGAVIVKWRGSRVIDSSLVLMVGTFHTTEMVVSVSAPHEDSSKSVDDPYDPIPYCKQDLVHIMNRVPIGFHSVADNGTIIWANNTLLSILGYESIEYIGQSLFKFVHDLPKLYKHAEAVRAGKHIPSFPYGLIAKDGSVKKFTASIDANFFPDGRFHYSRTFFRYDVDEIVNQAIVHERLEKQTALAAEKDRFLRVMFHEIRTPLHNLSNSFHSVVRQSKLATAVIDEMSYQIDACTGLVEDLSFSTMFESDQVLHPRPVRMNLRKELEYLLNYVSLYHDLELNSRPLNIEREIDFSIPEVILVDHALLKALSHLIKNAVKYCAPNGTVSIAMTYAENANSESSGALLSPKGSQLRNGHLSVSIKNTVSEMMNLVLVNKMFQSAYANCSLAVFDSLPSAPSASSVAPTTPLSVDSLSHDSRRSDSPHSTVSDSLVSSEGLGLGLYVAYNIISNLGGLLECSGSESESVFSFSLGVQARRNETRLSGSRSTGGGGAGAAASVSMLSQSANKKWFHAFDSVEGNKHVDCSGLKSELSLTVEHVRGHKPRILVVDDSPICRKVLVKALESNGYDTDTACDGKEAVDKLERPPCLYDAVLMDLRMPIMDGITATRVCKAQAHVRELPIIIVTAELGEEVRRECMEAGASHFISKPAKMDELLELVKSVLDC